MMKVKNRVRNKLKQGNIKVFDFVNLTLISLMLLSSDSLKASTSDSELIFRAEQSIQNISTLEAEFTQISSDGSYAVGKFYFRRPFQMRLEYYLEKPYNLITTRKWLIVDEPSNKKVTNYPISETPLKLLLEERFSLTGEEFSTKARIDNALVEITLGREEKEFSGTLILLFETDSMNLRGWIITDAIGVQTKVTLQNEIYGRKLPNKLFGRPLY